MSMPAPQKPVAVAGKEPPPQPARQTPKDDKPSVKNPGAFFIGKEVTIYASHDHIVTKAYCDDTKPGETGVFGPVTLLDASFGDDGAPKWGFIRYREKNSRKYFYMDLLNLEGCSMSVSIARAEEDEA